MGIAGLLKNLHPLLVPPPTHLATSNNDQPQPQRNNPKIQHNIRQFSNKSLAIDASSWLHKAAYTCAERLVEATENGTRDRIAEEKYCKYMIDRCSELLTWAQIDKIYLVFDGIRVPLKSNTNAERESKRQSNIREARRLMSCGRRKEAQDKYKVCVKGNEQMARVVAAKVEEKWGKDDSGMNDSVRVKCIWSPYEADSQLAKLCIDGWAHAVVTEDSDVLVYSAVARRPFPIIYKLDRKDGSCDVVTMDWLLNPNFLASMNGYESKSKLRRRKRRERDRDLDYIYNDSPLDDEENDDKDEDENDGNDSGGTNDDNIEKKEVHPCEVEYDDQGMAPVRRALPLPSSSSNGNNSKGKKKGSGGKDAGNAALLTYLRSFAYKEYANPGEGVRLFVQACVLSGCDYIANRISKVGPVGAFKLVKEASHRDAAIRFERVLKSLPAGSKLVAEVGDKSSEDDDVEDEEYDDFLELPDNERDAKEKYEELLSKSEAVFYYHLAKELSTDKIVPLVAHNKSSEVDVDDKNDTTSAEVGESFRPCIERFKGGLKFVGSAEEALKNKPQPLPALTGRGSNQMPQYNNNGGWMSTRGGAAQSNYNKPSTNSFFQRKKSVDATSAAPKPRTTAVLPAKETGLDKYFRGNNQQKTTTTDKRGSLLQAGKKSNHFQKQPTSSNSATVAQSRKNPFAAFSRIAEQPVSKKKSPIPTLSDRATDKAMMKSPLTSPIRFDYGGFTPHGNSEKKSTEVKSCIDTNTTSNVDNDRQEDENEERKQNERQLNQPITSSIMGSNKALFDYSEGMVPESPPKKSISGSGALSTYINLTKPSEHARRVSTSPPEQMKGNSPIERKSINQEDIIDLIDDDDEDLLAQSLVNENQPNFSRPGGNTAPIKKSSVSNRPFKSPYPITSQTSSTLNKKKKVTSSSALLAGFARQAKRSSSSSSAGSSRTKKSKFFPTKTTESKKSNLKRPKGTPSLESFYQ